MGAEASYDLLKINLDELSYDLKNIKQIMNLHNREKRSFKKTSSC